MRKMQDQNVGDPTLESCFFPFLIFLSEINKIINKYIRTNIIYFYVIIKCIRVFLKVTNKILVNLYIRGHLFDDLDLDLDLDLDIYYQGYDSKRPSKGFGS